MPILKENIDNYTVFSKGAAEDYSKFVCADEKLGRKKDKFAIFFANEKDFSAPKQYRSSQHGYIDNKDAEAASFMSKNPKKLV